MRGMALLFPLLPAPLFLLFCLLPSSLCRRKWEYTSQTDASYAGPDRDPDNAFANEWRNVWKDSSGPGSRRGHSIVLLGTKLILFAGRGNEAQKPHVPKTYKIGDKDGILEFETYEDQPVSPLYESNNTYSCKREEVCTTKNGIEVCQTSWGGVDELANEEEKMKMEQKCGYVPVGVYYNDVWEYDLDCTRYADMACSDRGWEVLKPGVIDGGCQILAGNEICTAPSERWHHGSAMFDDQTMLIYGGFSQRCQDYCDDMWSFDTIQRNK